MLTPQIIVYVHSQLMQGASEEKIAADLSVAGWSSGDIAEVFAHMRGGSDVPPPPPASGDSFVPPSTRTFHKTSKVELGLNKKRYFMWVSIIGIGVFLLGVGIGFAYSQNLIAVPFFQKH